MKAKFSFILTILPLLLVSCQNKTSSSSPVSSGSAVPDASSEVSSIATSSEEVISSAESSTEEVSSSADEFRYESRLIPLYSSLGVQAGSFETYFINGVKNIPYISLNSFFEDNYPDFQVTVENGVFQVYYEVSGGTMDIDTETNVITFSDFYSLFSNPNFKSFVNSPVDTDYFQVEQVSYEANEGSTMERKVNLADYDIHTYLLDDENKTVLMPAQTVFNLFAFNYRLAYNGYAYFTINSLYDDLDNLTEHGAFIKAVPADYVYDETLRDFNYNELCLTLDFFYGMKDLRGYGDFDTVLTEAGIKAKIYDGEPNSSKFDLAMNDIFNVLLTDYGHTYVNVDGTSVFHKEKFVRDEEITFAQQMKDSSALGTQISEEKERLEIDTPILFKEASKTLILNFNSFTWFNKNSDDTLNLEGNGTSCNIVYTANEFIHNNEESVDNVIINLTTNGGGMDQAELYLSSWIHGEAYQYAIAPINNYAKSVTKYVADVNMDGTYDEKDNISGKKIYILTSNYSYSNGNVFPGEMKGTENVTLIGQKTGGGSCNVFPFTTALGNSFSMSTLTRATNRNWESIETGVEPDIVLDNPLDTCDYDSIISKYILTESND